MQETIALESIILGLSCEIKNIRAGITECEVPIDELASTLELLKKLRNALYKETTSELRTHD